MIFWITRKPSGRKLGNNIQWERLKAEQQATNIKFFTFFNANRVLEYTQMNTECVFIKMLRNSGQWIVNKIPSIQTSRSD